MFKIENEMERATVYIYGTIGADWWSPEDENRAKEFAQTLDELTPKPLDIHIDSAGGDVYEGFAIASAIQRYEGETHVYVDGMAASAASYVALMADKVSMNDFAMLMIHNAWTVARGNRDELRKAADQLEGIDGTIAGIISARSALSVDEVRAAMSAETWYTAAEAEDAGMCDEVIETGQRMAASIDQAIADRYSNMPGWLAVAGPEDPLGEIAVAAENANGTKKTPDGEPLGAHVSSQAAAASHALPNLHDNEARAAAGAILLGNRVYRKETDNVE